MQEVSGFSKLSKEQKLQWLIDSVSPDSREVLSGLKRFWHHDEEEQKIIDEFSENTISNHIMPYGIAPNFLINGKIYCIPMVIEESSVVAAASGSAKFWLKRGGFKAEVISTLKAGQVHFFWNGDKNKLHKMFALKKNDLIEDCSHLTANMEKRGGGVCDIDLKDLTDKMDNYYQLEVTFETCNAMGANFINSVLENISKSFEYYISMYDDFTDDEKRVEIVMSILTNYTPQSLVRAHVECSIEDLGDVNGFSPDFFAKKFARAVAITKVDRNRAVTHNKGIYNGIDAVVLATGNDFRAVEACGHAYAARNGVYSGLTDVDISNGKFRLSIEIPLALGTVGGLTSLHPTAKSSFELLGRPDSRELMEIVACVGLATNFAAVKSLVTTGIQKGHMKMHLLNICRQFGANENEIKMAKSHFADKVVSYRGVQDFLDAMRKVQ